jgi:hypothetical protein
MEGSCVNVRSKEASQAGQNLNFGCRQRYLAPGLSLSLCLVSVHAFGVEQTSDRVSGFGWTTYSSVSVDSHGKVIDCG